MLENTVISSVSSKQVVGYGRKGNSAPISLLLPCPKLGHSFSSDDCEGYLFHSLANESEDLNNTVLTYLNDLYELEPRDGFVVVDHTFPTAQGNAPSLRARPPSDATGKALKS